MCIKVLNGLFLLTLDEIVYVFIITHISSQKDLTLFTAVAKTWVIRGSRGLGPKMAQNQQLSFLT